MKDAEWIAIGMVVAVLLVAGVVFLLLYSPSRPAPTTLLLDGVGAEPVVAVVDAMQIDVVWRTGNGA